MGKGRYVRRMCLIQSAALAICRLVFGYDAYDAALPYGHAICLDVILHCAESAGTVVSNFGFLNKSIQVSGNLKAPQQCQSVLRADAIIGPVKNGGQHCV